MKNIPITSGRLVQRVVSEGEYAVGILHLDPSAAIHELTDYLLLIEDSHVQLLEIPNAPQMSFEHQVMGLDELLCSPTWRKTTLPTARVVRLIKQFDDSNGWLVFGPHLDSGLTQDRWVDIHHNWSAAIAPPESIHGEKAGGLARKAMWPHPDGNVYALVPNSTLLAQTLAETTNFRIARDRYYGINLIANFRKRHVNAVRLHPLWANNIASHEDVMYGKYLQILYKNGFTDQETPRTAQQVLAQEARNKELVQILVEEMGSTESLSAPKPLSTQERERILNTSTDPLECANAIFEALLHESTPTLASAPAWDHMPINYVVLAAAPILSENRTDLLPIVLNKISTAHVTWADHSVRNMLWMLKNIHGAPKELAQSEVCAQIAELYTPPCWNEEWKDLLEGLRPALKIESLLNWACAHESAHAYIFGQVLSDGEIPWDQKIKLVTQLMTHPHDFVQSKVFEEVYAVNPLPTHEHWDAFFAAVGAPPTLDGGLSGKSLKTLEEYHQYYNTQRQKEVLHSALTQSPSQSAPRKKI